MKNGFALISLLFFSSSLAAQLQFTNNGDFKIHKGVGVSYFGNFINNGSVIDSGLVITMTGTNPQQIGGTSTTTFKNLTLNNSGGSYLSSNERITGELKITSGTFSTTGYDFTLVSDLYGTAHIAPILGDFSGNITMQRYLPLGPTSWRFLASPVTGVKITDWQDDFVTSGFPGSNFPNFPFVSVFTYDETVGGTNDNGYNGATHANNSIVPGTGYWCYIGPVPLTIDVTGPPVKFGQSFPVTYSANAGFADDGWVMIGNPYPSTIDWSSGAWAKTNINNAVYVWNPANQQYASWVSGVGTNGGSNLIASSQSFWVQTYGASPSLTCSENIKVSSSSAFLKPPLPVLNEILRLKINGNSFSDETVLRFVNGATNGYDVAEDARKLFSSNANVPGISSLDSTLTDLSINGLPPVDSIMHIPIKTLVGVSGSYTISIDSFPSILKNYCIVLEDLVTSTKSVLNNSLSYAFSILDTTKAARFRLHISATSQVSAIQPTCFNYEDGKAIAVGLGAGPWNYLWFNTSNANIRQTFSSYLPDTVKNLSAGQYSVQISDINSQCGSFTNNIIIAEPPPVIAGFSFMGGLNSVVINDSLIIQNTSTGALRYKWNFGDGTALDTLPSPVPHHYKQIGKYKVSLIAIFENCSDTLNKTIDVYSRDLSGIHENGSLSEAAIFPNPGTGLVHVKFRNSGHSYYQLEIFDLSGKDIYSAHLLSDQTEIDLSGLAKGMYFYQILFEDQHSIKGKLILE